MSETTFGDYAPEDSFTPDNDPDPYYVAQRLHEVRNWVEWMASGDDRVTISWEDLSSEEREVGIAIGKELTEYLLSVGRDGAAVNVHDVRRYFGPMPRWDELDAAEHDVALAMIVAVVDWLEIEGTVID